MNEIYKNIYTRRDVRNEFVNTPIPDDVIARVLCAAHHAPSVGLSQPWRFVVIDKPSIKKAVHGLFEEANLEAITLFDPAQQSHYATLKLEGILESAYNVCITCDRRDQTPVLGQTHQPDTDIYSTACAVQNFWLAAKAEQLGVGWVSILDANKLRDVLGIPEGVIPLAYLCVGYVSEFHQIPDLIREGWSRRKPLDEVVSRNHWHSECDNGLANALSNAYSHRESLLGISEAEE
ncbi:MAG: 5,6-dimethylbenzimidazole synthase [Pseudomonadota bacterium]